MATSIVKLVNEVESFLFDFSDRAPVVAGETLSSPTVTATPTGLTIGSPSVTAADFDDVTAGQGVKVLISGWVSGTVYTLTCTVTTSGGSTLICKGTIRGE